MFTRKTSAITTLLIAATAATMFAAVAGAKDRGIPVPSGPGSVCRIESVRTPANANLMNPYAAHVFDGNVQAYVPPVPPGYHGDTRTVQAQICTPA
jgi:hypothetical protein